MVFVLRFAVVRYAVVVVILIAGVWTTIVIVVGIFFVICAISVAIDIDIDVTIRLKIELNVSLVACAKVDKLKVLCRVLVKNLPGHVEAVEIWIVVAEGYIAISTNLGVKLEAVAQRKAAHLVVGVWSRTVARDY